MNTTKNIILGISPGTRHIGLAVMVESWLRDFRMKSLQKVDPIDRPKAAVRIVQKMIWKHQVTAIAIKVNPQGHSSASFDQMVDGIKFLATCNNIPCTAYGIDTLYDTCLIAKNQPRNKASLAISLLHPFPQLLKTYTKVCSLWGLPHFKVFEAVACSMADSEKTDNWKYEKL